MPIARHTIARPNGLSRRIVAAATAIVAVLSLTACGSTSADTSTAKTGTDSASTSGFPVTIKHAYGTTEIKQAPERVATVGWGSDDVTLALGVVPVTVPKQTFGKTEDGYLPWVKAKLDDMNVAKADLPEQHDESDSIDMEAIAAARPDVILGMQSGITEEQYKTLSKIAPTIPWQQASWGDPWRSLVETTAKVLGKQQEGEKLIAKLEDTISEAAAKYPQIKGKSASVMYFDSSKLSSFSVYTTHDVRPQFLNDLGFETPESIKQVSETTDSFYKDISSEQADQFADIDVIVTYGTPDLLAAMQKDPLLSKIPAVKRGSVVVIDTTSELANALDAMPLSIEAATGDYAKLLGEAASKVNG